MDQAINFSIDDDTSTIVITFIQWGNSKHNVMGWDGIMERPLIIDYYLLL